MSAFFLVPLIAGIWLAIKAMTSKLPIPLRILLAGLALLASQSFNIQRYFFGSLAGPDIPFWLLLLLIWGFGTVMLVFLCFAILDVCGLLAQILRLMRRKSQDAAEGATMPASPSSTPASPSRRIFLAAAAAGGVRLLVPAGAAVAGAGVHAALAAPRPREWEINLPALPRALDGIRLVHMADLHVGPHWNKERARATVATVNAASADLVLMTGDLADGQPEWRCADGAGRVEVARLFAGMKSRLGTFCCTGNHEYISNYQAWMKIWNECGMRFLHNDCIVFNDFDGASLVVGGLNDPSGGSRPARASVFASAPDKGPSSFRILLEHRPSQAVRNASRGAQLQLSGHTHGGQCPLLDILVARANNGFVRDWYQVGDMALYVTSGASQWPGFAIRLGIPTEIAIITLKTAQDNRITPRLVS